MKAWITKYALTSGIQEVDGEADKGMLTVIVTRFGNVQHFHGNDWHPTREAAIAHAEKMRQKRIESLKESIAKLEKLSFS